jgi:hypothetical protein
MHMGHEIDIIVDRGIHLIWRSQDVNNKRLWCGRLCTNHILGGVVIKLSERSCRYKENIMEYIVVWLVHQEDLRIEKK